MFNFSKKKTHESDTEKNPQQPQNTVSPLVQALKRQLDASDPAHRMAVGGKEMQAYLIRAMAKADPHGVRVEDMLCILGSLCGYSCQIAELADIMNHKDSPAGVMVLKLKDGTSAFAGESILKKIFQAGNSPWSLIGGGAQRIDKLDVFKSFDIKELISHSSSTLGKPEFGVIRVEQQHQSRQKPQEWLEALWRPYSVHLGGIISSQSEWPACFGVAIQEAMVVSKDQLDAKTAITIVIESILTTSKFALKPDPNILDQPGVTKRPLIT